VESNQSVITRRTLLIGLAGFTASAMLAACGGGKKSDGAAAGTSAGTAAGSSGASGPLSVVAAENFWGSIASQLGGDRVKVTSIISNPDADPHDYEPTPNDARTVADADYVIVNGAGYDPWLSKLLEANPVDGRPVLNVGDLVGKKEGDNPHLWYSPDFVSKVIDQITKDYSAIAPSDGSFFSQQQSRFSSSTLKPYHDLIAAIKQTYASTKVGSTESIFIYMATALGLDLISPPGFMQAISEGNDVTAADKAKFDQQVTKKEIKVLVYNAQNATPDTDAVKQKATSAGIPVVAITETLSPASDTFEAWQVSQLQQLQQALARATGQ
jgi:zinc/manganese transport system substrate-binding protein